jgi:integrase
MNGSISPRGKCPKCSNPFQYFKKLGYVCADCQIIPKRFRFVFFYNGQRMFIYSDKHGKPLDTYDRAKDVQELITNEIQSHTFDSSKYMKAELEKFYCSNLLNQFLDAKLPDIAPSYKTDYKRMVDRAKGYFSFRDVRDVRKIDIISFKKHLTTTYKMRSKTLKNHVDLFKTFMRYCHNEFEVIDKVPPFPDIEVKDPVIRWIPQDAQIQSYSLVKDELKMVIAFLMLHGCRPSEARALRCKNINLDTQSVTISATFSGTIYREKRKGKKSKDLVIPLHPEMLTFLTDRVKNNLPEAYVFINHRTGRHFNKNTLSNEWSRIRTALELDKSLRLYDATRHSFASQLINLGTSIYKVSKLLGHSSVKMTEKYTHSSVEYLKADMQKISLRGVSQVCLDSNDATK